MIAEVAMTNEALLLAGLTTLAGVVVMLWRQQEKYNVRQTVRADKCEEEHQKCRERHASSEKATAVLTVEVAHLREQLKLPVLPVAMAPPVSLDNSRDSGILTGK